MGQVKAIPEGFTSITPFLNIKNASAAIEMYKRAFGAEVRREFKSPSGQVMNCELAIGNAMVRISEAVRDAPTQAGLGIYVENADTAWQRAVSAGCKVVMPLTTMFWGEKWGLVEDGFGNRWSISQRVEDVSDEELHRRGLEAAKQMQAAGK